MKIERPDPVVWKLFSALDEEADELHATIRDVLGAAAIIVATYMIRMREELRAQGLDGEALTRGDEAAWRAFRTRTEALLQDGETVH